MNKDDYKKDKDFKQTYTYVLCILKNKILKILSYKNCIKN